eukprot:GHVS01017002.1.p1 GENE.GHVS01017002.1~~GHVS01017002.1.p1  ORF type:complete len:716 (+),score=70.80 GHVS01017002.1:60-2150(+)
MAKFRTGQRKLLAAIPSFLFMLLVFSLQPNLGGTTKIEEFGKSLEQSTEVVSCLSDFWAIFQLLNSHDDESCKISAPQPDGIVTAATEWLNRFVKASDQLDTECKATDVQFDTNDDKVGFNLGNVVVNVPVGKRQMIGKKDIMGAMLGNDQMEIFANRDIHQYLMTLGEVLQTEYVEVVLKDNPSPSSRVVKERFSVKTSAANNIYVSIDETKPGSFVQKRDATVEIKRVEKSGQGGELLCELKVTTKNTIKVEEQPEAEKNQLVPINSSDDGYISFGHTVSDERHLLVQLTEAVKEHWGKGIETLLRGQDEERVAMARRDSDRLTTSLTHYGTNDGFTVTTEMQGAAVGNGELHLSVISTSADFFNGGSDGSNISTNHLECFRVHHSLNMGAVELLAIAHYMKESRAVKVLLKDCADFISIFFSEGKLDPHSVDACLLSAIAPPVDLKVNVVRYSQSFPYNSIFVALVYGRQHDLVTVKVEAIPKETKDAIQKTFVQHYPERGFPSYQDLGFLLGEDVIEVHTIEQTSIAPHVLANGWIAKTTEAGPIVLIKSGDSVWQTRGINASITHLQDGRLIGNVTFTATGPDFNLKERSAEMREVQNKFTADVIMQWNQDIENLNELLRIGTGIDEYVASCKPVRTVLAANNNKDQFTVTTIMKGATNERGQLRLKVLSEVSRAGAKYAPFVVTRTIGVI